MTGNVVARRYARALFAVGQQKGDLDAYGKDLAAVAEVVAASDELKKTLKSPIFSGEEKKKVISQVLDKVDSGTAVRNFCYLLADKDRLAVLPEIQAYFAQMADEAAGILRGNLVTAVDLDEKRQKDLGAKLEKQIGRKIELEYDVKPSILGGVILKVGDKVLDASLRAQLDNLKENIKRGA
jgi:F-type H+-transporting ATPase subunit delta